MRTCENVIFDKEKARAQRDLRAPPTRQRCCVYKTRLALKKVTKNMKKDDSNAKPAVQKL